VYRLPPAPLKGRPEIRSEIAFRDTANFTFISTVFQIRNGKFVKRCINYKVYVRYICKLWSYLSSLYSKLTLSLGCGLAYPYDWRDFVVTKKKSSMGLSVLISRWSCVFLSSRRHLVTLLFIKIERLCLLSS
jgi:hypothetical protein